MAQIKDPLAKLDVDQVLQTPLATMLMNTWKNAITPNAKIERYMHGDHDLSFATAKFNNAFGGLFREFAENQLPRLMEALADYLQVDKVESDENSETLLKTWLDANLFAVRAGQVHNSAYTFGNGYVILASDDDENLRMYWQDSKQIACLYDPERPDQLLAAIKVWQDVIAGKWRMNVYTRTGTFAYQADGKTTPTLKKFKPLEDDDDPAFTPHKVQGIVPVFHFANEPGPDGQGKSELNGLYPLQDALNKDIMDRLVAQEFQAFRQRWATGIEVQTDEVTGLEKPPVVPAVDRLWYSASENAKFGDFEPIELKQFLDVAMSDRMAMAAMARVPVHHLGFQQGEFPSGESQKTAEQPILLKSQDRQILWGSVWASICRYYFAFVGKPIPAKLDVKWVDLTPRDKMNESQGDLNEANTAVIWNELGVPKTQLLLEHGYSQLEIKQFAKEKQAEDEQAMQMNAEALAKQVNASGGGQQGQDDDDPGGNGNQ
jgi:hypothetical protein